MKPKEQGKWFGKGCEHQEITWGRWAGLNNEKLPMYISCQHDNAHSYNCNKQVCPLEEGWL